MTLLFRPSEVMPPVDTAPWTERFRSVLSEYVGAPLALQLPLRFQDRPALWAFDADGAADAAEAHKLMESSEHTGKIVLSW